MMRIKRPTPQQAFTFVDFLIVVTIVAVLGLLLLPNLAITKHRSPRINCVSNLKQIGVAFRMWANDHGEEYPMAIPAEKGGALESALSGHPLASFQVMSKELQTPKVLHCPSDEKRKRATEFAVLNDKTLSYLTGLEAHPSQPQTILTADRNIAVDGAQVKPGLVTVPDFNRLGWSRSIHREQGNIGFGDGSAAQMNNYALQRHSTGVQTNRLAVP